VREEEAETARANTSTARQEVLTDGVEKMRATGERTERGGKGRKDESQKESAFPDGESNPARGCERAES
jgi:hypothetical protein